MHGVHRLPPATVDVKNAYVPSMHLDGAVLILKHRFPFSFQNKNLKTLAIFVSVHYMCLLVTWLLRTST